MLFVSGQLPLGKDGLITGHVGETVSLEKAQEAARLCALNIFAQAKNKLINLNRIQKIINLRGFVQCSAQFTDLPKVLNGASDFFSEVLGEGQEGHTRAVVGVMSLPLNAVIEIEAIISFDE